LILKKSKINNLKNENTIEKLKKNSETLYIISNKKEQLKIILYNYV
jgi:hypothetical protein